MYLFLRLGVSGQVAGRALPLSAPTGPSHSKGSFRIAKKEKEVMNL